MAEVDPLVVAYHESGHACAFLTYGWRFRWVEIFPSDAAVTGCVRTLSSTYGAHKRAVAAMCGPAAEEALTGTDALYQPLSHSDRDMAQAALARLSPRPSLEIIMIEARRLVESRWLLIHRIAELAALSSPADL